MPLRAGVAGLRTTLIFMSPTTLKIPGPLVRSRSIRSFRVSNTATTSLRLRLVFSLIAARISDLLVGLLLAIHALLGGYGVKLRGDETSTNLPKKTVFLYVSTG